MPAWRGTGRNSGEAGPLTRAERQAKFNCKLQVPVADEVTRLQTPPCAMQQCRRRSKLLTVHDRSGRRKQYKCKWKSTRVDTALQYTSTTSTRVIVSNRTTRLVDGDADQSSAISQSCAGRKTKMRIPYPVRDCTTGTTIGKSGKKSATAIPRSDRRRGPGRNLMLCIVVAGGGGGLPEDLKG